MVTSDNYVSHGPFIDDKHDDLPCLKMMIFHSYLKLPEGSRYGKTTTSDGVDWTQRLSHHNISLYSCLTLW